MNLVARAGFGYGRGKDERGSRRSKGFGKQAMDSSQQANFLFRISVQNIINLKIGLKIS